MLLAPPSQRGRAAPGGFHVVLAHSDDAPRTIEVRTAETSGTAAVAPLVPATDQSSRPSSRDERSFTIAFVMPPAAPAGSRYVHRVPAPLTVQPTPASAPPPGS